MTKKCYQIILLSLMLMGISVFTYAQQDRNKSIIRLSLKGLEYEVKAGIAIGGTAPCLYTKKFVPSITIILHSPSPLKAM